MRIAEQLSVHGFSVLTPGRREQMVRAVETGALTADQAARFSFDSLPVARPAETAEMMAVTAAQRALAAAGVAPAEVGFLVHAWVADTEADWRIASKIARLAGAGRAVATGVRQQCNGGAIGLQIAAAYLLAEPRTEHGLVLTADALGASWPRRWQHGLGDAATALVVSKQPGKLALCSIVSAGRPEHEATLPAGNPFRRSGPEDDPLPPDNDLPPQLVFRLRSCVRDAVRGACADAGLDPADPRIEAVLVTRVSSAVVQTLTAGTVLAGVAGEVVNLAAHSGHLFAGDLAANLAHLAEVLTPGRFALVLSFGVGFSATCVVVRMAGEGVSHA